jgi:alpha,alpha-trehalase
MRTTIAARFAARRLRGNVPTSAVWLTLLALLPFAAQPRTPNESAQPPQALFQDLFVAVQTGQIYPDGKAFPDAIPNSSPDDILAQYHEQKPISPTALRDFVAAHFSLPAQVVGAPSPPDKVSIVTHIDGLWDQLTRTTTTAPPYSSSLALPQPYVVPGGRFREIYYWDTYFTMLGLAQSGRQELVTDMVRDFAYLIDTYGHVPNGARTYYLSRSQPPFFFDMVGLTSAKDPAAAFARYLPQLRREYGFWMDGERGLKPGAAHRRVVAMPDGSILNRFWDDRDTPRDESYGQDIDLARTSHRPASQLYRDIRAAAESGWDFGSRWFADGHTPETMDTTEILPADLNALLFGLENAIRAGCERNGDKACADDFKHRAEARRGAVDRYLWDEPMGAYLDYRWTRKARVPRLSAATLYPLFVGMASDAQASAVAKTTAERLLKAGGIVTTPLTTGQQWDSPNGWAPVQWIAISGLRDYHQGPLAETIACRWMVNVNDVYAQSGKLVEKYNVVATGHSGGGGEYPTQDGFGWTNGVMRKLMALYPADAESATPARCPGVPVLSHAE